MCAERWKIDRMRRLVAEQVERDLWDDGIDFSKAMEIMDKFDMFGDWTDYEIDNRSVDIMEIEERIYQEVIGY